MKKIFLTIILFASTILVFSQVKKPTLMVVPSDNWCFENGYTQQFDNQGKAMELPNYKAALQQSFELKSVIAKINELMIDRGFPLKDLEASLKSIESTAAEDAMLTSKSGADIIETPVDILKRTAKADIWIELSWKVNQQGPKKSVSFILAGKDAYTDKQVAGSSGTGTPSFTAELAILLEEAVLSHLDNFNAQLQSHFDDLFANGRETSLRIRVFGSSEYDLESEFNDEELGVLIENWVSDNTVEHRFSTTDATENMMLFEQVRIPLYDEKGRPVDMRGWARGLQKHLKDSYQITSKLMTKGLGQAQLVIGDK